MYIVNNMTSSDEGIVLDYIPYALRRFLYGIDISEIDEIYLHAGRPMCVIGSEGMKFVSDRGKLTDNPYEAPRVNTSHISEAMELISKSSVYSVEEEIRDGYITIEGGHRIGICGNAVIRNGRIAFVKEISSLNYRIAREVKGAASEIMRFVTGKSGVRNTLIISPPGAGKTTMLRDIVRQLSNSGVRVCVADERREIAAMYKGRTGFDLGSCTSVFSGAPKAAGMLMMLRSMSPDVIVTDEIGTSADAAAVAKIINSGAKIITTIHGFNLEQIRKRKDLKQVLPFFETFITLSKSKGVGTIEDVTQI